MHLGTYDFLHSSYSWDSQPSDRRHFARKSNRWVRGSAEEAGRTRTLLWILMER